MTRNKAAEPSPFPGVSSAPAKASNATPKSPRTRKVSAKPEVSTPPTVLSSEVTDLQALQASVAQSANPKTTRAKSTAVTHRHKKQELVHDLHAESNSLHVPVPFVEPSPEDVAKLAYSYYVARGCQPGNQADDWFRALTELRGKLNPRS